VYVTLQGQLECDSETVFELAALVMQAVRGDYVEYVFLLSLISFQKLICWQCLFSSGYLSPYPIPSTSDSV